MHAHMPPFSRPSPAASVTPAEEVPSGQPVISDTESKLRTLKHYLYHAGLLVDELLAADAHVAPQLVHASAIDLKTESIGGQTFICGVAIRGSALGREAPGA
jgi:hypothetical protein